MTELEKMLQQELSEALALSYMDLLKDCSPKLAAALGVEMSAPMVERLVECLRNRPDLLEDLRPSPTLQA
tara:strand:- start:148 stop:357 length:210 start_codon:yes stop_codon:yes gene_type:complete